MIILETMPLAAARFLQRLPATYSNARPAPFSASQNGVGLFSPCESPFGVISAERPAYILN